MRSSRYIALSNVVPDFWVEVSNYSKYSKKLSNNSESISYFKLKLKKSAIVRGTILKLFSA